MPVPYFYTTTIQNDVLTLDEETSRHIVQVLRMEKADHIRLTDGHGHSADAEITTAHKKHCVVAIQSREFSPQPTNQVSIAISLIKNTSRFEWFLEKATELGTTEIIPLLCTRTESEKFKLERFTGICKSAMLQSQQTWLPRLQEPVAFMELINNCDHHQRFIAHCADDDKEHLAAAYDAMLDSHLILIGPEGDFTPEEIMAAKNAGFVPVSLGNTRLRTETAGIFAAAVCNSF